ncbi:hypothetical protein M0805_007762 [Coniferiporia weirii]|nr:hypothetical protein M0805_007762 [Coniferiporia weirii]
MVLKLYGTRFSTYTQNVIVTLKELNVPYELVPVNMLAGEHRSEDYLATTQPFGQFPVLVEEDGFKLYESRAITRCLIAKYGRDSGLIPTGDMKKIGLFEQAVSIESSNFTPFASAIAVEKIFKPMDGEKGDDDRAAEQVKVLEEKLKVYEIILSKQKYLAGDELTLADLLHLPYGTLITDYIGFTGLNATPNVARWWADISSRPSWQAVAAEGAAAIAALQKEIEMRANLSP